jgi:hypothetical protein
VSFVEFADKILADNRCKVLNIKGKQVGDVISADANGVIGLAIIRLDDLIEPSQLRASVVPEVETLAPATSTENFASEERSGIEIFPFRPDWWPEVDPLTGADIFQATS